jgi:hypothetical protein
MERRYPMPWPKSDFWRGLLIGIVLGETLACPTLWYLSGNYLDRPVEALIIAVVIIIAVILDRWGYCEYELKYCQNNY